MKSHRSIVRFMERRSLWYMPTNYTNTEGADLGIKFRRENLFFQRKFNPLLKYRFIFCKKSSALFVVKISLRVRVLMRAAACKGRFD